MEISSVSLLLLLLLSASVSIWTPVAAESNDAVALLAFKAKAVHGDGDVLASWNRSNTGGFCSWEGVKCRGRPRRVVELSLPSRGLAGVLSPSIGNLSYLTVLNLSYNSFDGEIPAELGCLGRLQALSLGHNGFSGEIPSNLSSCTKLTLLSIRFNQLRGRVPKNLGDKMARLRVLDLRSNHLTGGIPTSLGNLSSLNALDLSSNQLEGTIPPHLGHIQGLLDLTLAFNHLSGRPPHSLYNLSSLQFLQIQRNMLQGEISSNIGSSFPNISFISFGWNQFNGPIPSSLSNLTALQVLELSGNRLSGYVPSTMGKLRALERLYLLNNMLEADDRQGWEFITSLSNCSRLQDLLISNNSAFSGHIPSSIVNLSTTVQVLGIYDTEISGSIPSDIGNLVNLEFLSMANTSISGVIPGSICKLVNLGVLGLYNTDLSGVIPTCIGNLTQLTILYAYNSKLEGEIPASLGKLKNLLSLDLSMNRLNGMIPGYIFKLPALSGYLDLSYNSLSGLLPFEVGSLGNLNKLVLSGNQLFGEIPNSIGGCTVLQELWLDDNSFEESIPQSLINIKGLTVLNLSMNKLSGNIPDAIGSIRNLQQLYLAHNNLSGTIPIVLQNLTSLLELDLSFNNLQGEVPNEGIFRSLFNLSIIGNKELCGGIPQLHLAPCHTNYAKKNRKRWLIYFKIALATTGAILFLASIIAFIQLTYKKLRRKQNNPFLPSIAEEHYEKVSYRTLESGTNGFSEVNLLGEGSFGAVYKCTFQDRGTIVAVKVFKLQQSGSTRSFVTECEALKRARHRCLIKIITCCSSVNRQGQEFKALIFEFMPNGSLNDWLHPKSGMPTLRNTLSLEQRLNIAINIMDALDYLHNHCQPPIIHCDLKPSNILLAEDMSTRVGDFGISRILPESASISLQNSNSTIGIRGSIGYIPPEYGEGSSISTLGDVYSLGILLLEMFTGRSPTDATFRGALDLHKFSEDAFPERIWEISDSTMWMHKHAYNSTARSRTENCLVSVIALGISCSKKQPSERILIQDATTKMHAIRDSYLQFDRPHVMHVRSSNNPAMIETV